MTENNNIKQENIDNTKEQVVIPPAAEEDKNCAMCGEKYCHGYNKLDAFNWLEDILDFDSNREIVEVRFKNTHKGFYRNINNLDLRIGDLVAVEASPGHDIGRVSMTGRLVMKLMNDQDSGVQIDDLKKIYRKAKETDIQKYEEAKSMEEPTMLRSRQIAQELGLNMKIGDVEYQGDKTKAIFYYIADGRVDFRKLIKVLAEEFHIRIEMKQIGARQESGRIGGIGSCGRELCCSTYLTNFTSVSTVHAKYQELSLNPQKLTGQCGKLKCCLGYEVDCYIDAQKSFPPRDVALELADQTMYFQKMEVYKRIFWYSTDTRSAESIVPVPVERVAEIIELNSKGIKPQKLIEEPDDTKKTVDLVEIDSVTRFDNTGRGKSKKKRVKKTINKDNFSKGDKINNEK